VSLQVTVGGPQFSSGEVPLCSPKEIHEQLPVHWGQETG
jgi:hypothetical protein